MSNHNEKQNKSSDEEIEESFHDMSVTGKVVTVVGIVLLIIIVIGFVFGLYFFGLVGVFEILGVQYESIWSLVIFVGSFLILSLIIELFSRPLFTLLTRKTTGKMKRYLTQLMVETASNLFVLFTVDEFMGSMTLSLQTELIIALLLAVVEIVFGDDKKEKEQLKN